MSFIVIFCLIGLIGLLAVITALLSKSETDAEVQSTATLIAVIALVVNILMIPIFSVHFIDEREVGVVKTFGRITSTVDKGMQFTAPWQSVDKWSARTQIIRPKTNCSNNSPNCMNAGSIDIQDVYVQGVLNLFVDKSTVIELARRTTDYEDTIVQNRMQQVTKAIISQYKAENILGAREEIRSKIREALGKELSEYSITVDDFLIVDIDFTDTYRVQIDKASEARQQAVTAQNQVAIEEAKAKQAEATALGVANSQRIAAQGRADSVLLEARAQADANDLLNRSLTPNVLQLESIKRLNPNIQWGILPSGNVTITNFSDLFKAPAPTR